MDVFTGKSVIVTGAASGIGRALSEELAERGAKVIMADINAEPLKEAAAQLSDSGLSAEAALLDVTDFQAFEQLVEDTVGRYGRLDYIFNNAGITIGGEAQDHTYEDWHREIDADLYGVVHGVAAAYPVMVRQGSGHIVNTSSFAGLCATPLQISYVTSKWGVVGLSEALRVEGKLHGVKVSVVCPGFVRTGMYDTIKMIGLDYDKVVRMAPEGMPPRQAARGILRGVERNKPIILVPRLLIVPLLLQRLVPGLMRWTLVLATKMLIRAAKTKNE